jgi:hypothetical protein
MFTLSPHSTLAHPGEPCASAPRKLERYYALRGAEARPTAGLVHYIRQTSYWLNRLKEMVVINTILIIVNSRSR